MKPSATMPISGPEQAMQNAARLEANGQLAEAEAIYRQLVDQQPGFHPAWHALGLLAYHAGNLPLATELIDHAIGMDKSVALYQRNIGEMYRRLGKLDQAIAAGKRATALNPDDLDAHYNLGLAYTDSADYANAIKCYRRALKINSGHGLSWNNLGSAQEKSGNQAAAEDSYAKAVAINPQHTEAQNNLGAIYSEQGKLDEARACFNAAIDAQDDFIAAHYNLSSLKKYTPNDPHLTALELIDDQQIQRDTDTDIRFYFALGKAREDIGQYDRAFVAYEKGNRLQHALLPVDERHAEKLVSDIRTTFDREFFSTHQRAAYDSRQRPVFIVGMPRSGTTLIEQILSSHPQIHGAGELVTLSKVIHKALGGQEGETFTQAALSLGLEQFESLGRAYMQEVGALGPDSPVITDKMPANFFYVGMIHMMFPDAVIIHSMRDPMDSCFSCYARLFTDTMEFTYDLGLLGRYYVRYMQLMRHWHEVLPQGRILDVRYEDVVDDLEGQARRMLEAVGLPWDDACLDFHENKRHVKTASVAQVRKPIYKTSVARWEHFAKHLDPLMRIVKDYRK